jgi:hypothetical protein
LKIERNIEITKEIQKYTIQKIKWDDFSGVTKGILEFGFGELHFTEVLRIKDNPKQHKVTYNYHFMNNENEL